MLTVFPSGPIVMPKFLGMWCRAGGPARPADGPRRQVQKAKAPPCDGASAMNRKGLLPEVVDQAALDAQVVLLCAAKMRVQILKLDRTERQVARQLHVRAAA